MRIFGDKKDEKNRSKFISFIRKMTIKFFDVKMILCLLFIGQIINVWLLQLHRDIIHYALFNFGLSQY